MSDRFLVLATLILSDQNFFGYPRIKHPWIGGPSSYICHTADLAGKGRVTLPQLCEVADLPESSRSGVVRRGTYLIIASSLLYVSVLMSFLPRWKTNFFVLSNGFDDSFWLLVK